MSRSLSSQNAAQRAIQAATLFPALPFLALLAVLLIAAPASAHHGSASFDVGKKLTFKDATVTQWVWANPHCFLKFDAKDEKGKLISWTAETSNPPDMMNRGWSRTSFKPGDQITVTIEPVRNGSPIGRVLDVILPNGKTLSTNSAPPPKDADH